MRKFFAALLVVIMAPAAAIAVPVTPGSTQDIRDAGIFTFDAAGLTGVNAFAFNFTNAGAPIQVTAIYELNVGNADIDGAALSFSTQDETGNFTPFANPTTFASKGTIARATRFAAGGGLLSGDPLTGSLTLLMGAGESIFVNAGLNNINPADLTVTIISQIPLPASLLLLLSALGGLGFVSRRRKMATA